MARLRRQINADKVDFVSALKNVYENLGQVNGRADSIIAAGQKLEQLLDGRVKVNETNIALHEKNLREIADHLGLELTMSGGGSEPEKKE